MKKKQECGNWCCLWSIQTGDSNLGTNCTCWSPKASWKWATSSSACSVAMGLLWLKPQALTPLRPELRALQAPARQGTPVLTAVLLPVWGPRLVLSVASMSEGAGVHQLGFIEIKLLNLWERKIMSIPWKHYAEGSKPVTKGHILWDYIYIKCPQKLHP